MKRVRYIVTHHPGLFTEVHCETEGSGKALITPNYSLIDSLSYCVGGYASRGVTENPDVVKGVYWGMFAKPDENTYVGPWVEVSQ